MRVLDLQPRMPRGLRPLMDAIVTPRALLPLPAAMMLAALCAYMIVRIARHGRGAALINVDSEGILIEHPTRMRGRTRIAFERLAAVNTGGSRGREDEPHLPWHLRLLLRDGPPVLVPVPQRDQATVREALVAAIATFCPIRGAATGPDANAAPQREPTSRAQHVIPPAALRLTFDAYVQHYPDGLRFNLLSLGAWVMLQILRVGVLVWFVFMLADQVVGGRIPVFSFMQWTLVLGGGLFFVYALPKTFREGPASDRWYTIDVIGQTLVLSDPDFHGRSRQWTREQIGSIEIFGPLLALTRTASLCVRLTDGRTITLLYGYPLRLLRPIATELRRSLRLDHHD
jgi:hypothetical protein